VWAAGEAIEAGGWLCLLAEAGMVDRGTALALFSDLLPQSPSSRLPGLDPPLVVTNAWAEHLFFGDIDAALEVRALNGFEPDFARDVTVLQSAWTLVHRHLQDRRSHRFLSYALTADYDDWYEVFQEPADRLRAVSPLPHAGTIDWATMPQEYDGVASTVAYVEQLTAWAADETGDEGRNRARRTVTKSVGRLHRWRLDLAKRQVSERVGNAIENADLVFDRAIRAAEVERDDAWPGGFRATAIAALAAWDELTSEGPRTRDTPGGGGSEGLRQRERRRDEDVEEGVSVGVGVG
jgi:hypothetical protein